MSPHQTNGSAVVRSLLGIGLAVAVALGYFLARGRTGTWAVHNFQVEKGLQTIRVTWNSPSPYPSRVEVGAEGGGPLSLHSGTCDGKGRHEVLVRNLQPSTRYRVGPFLPDGRRGLATPFRLARFTTELTALETSESASDLIVRWRTSLPVRPTLRVTAADGTRLERAPFPAEGREHEVRLLDLASPVTGLALASETRLGERHEEDLTRALRSLVAPAAATLSFDPTKLIHAVGFEPRSVVDLGSENLGIEGLARKTPPEEVAKRRIRMGRRLFEELRIRGLADASDRVLPFLPFLLEHRVLTREMRQNLLAGLLDLALVFALAQHHRTDIQGLSPPRLGPFLQYGQTRLRSPKTVPIHGGPGDLAFVAFRILDSVPSRRALTFTVPAGSFSRAEIVVVTSGLDEDEVFRCSMNGLGTILILGTLRPKSKHRFYVALDPEVLRPGENELTVTMTQLPGLIRGGKAFIHEILLCLEK